MRKGMQSQVASTSHTIKNSRERKKGGDKQRREETNKRKEAMKGEKKTQPKCSFSKVIIKF